jgi:hypothetical protein
MRRLVYLFALLFAAFRVPAASFAFDEQIARWQESVEKAAWSFHERDADILSAVSQYGGDCDIHLIFERKRPSTIQLRLVRDGKQVLTLSGHRHSVFVTGNNVLYFAHFLPSAFGCSVAAYDLTTGGELWRTRLKGVGGVAHSAYRNLVNIRLSDDVITVVGHEAYGDYLELLDRKTGQRVAHRVFRKGYDDLSKPGAAEHR